MAKDYYRILGLTPDAGAEAIKRAYRRLVMEHHPDRRAGQTGPEKDIREINEAYGTLGNEAARTRYDAEQGFGRPDSPSFGGLAGEDADHLERFATGVYQPPKKGDGTRE